MIKNQNRNNHYWRYLSGIILTCLSFSWPGLRAQNIIPDTIIFAHQPAALVLFTDFKNSFVLSDVPSLFRRAIPVTIYGIAAGLKFRGLHQYTLGFYRLSKRAEHRLPDNIGNLNLINQRWRLSFLSVGYTYTFFTKGKFELKLPMELGIGRGIINAVDVINNVNIFRKGVIVPFQFGFIAKYRLTKWFGIQALVGYRKTVIGTLFNNNFDSPFYSLGLSLNFENIKDEFLKFQKKLKQKRQKNKNTKTV